MMRLLLLCLLLPTAAAYSEDRDEFNGSGDDGDQEAEDDVLFPSPGTRNSFAGSTGTAGDTDSDQMTLVVIVVAVVLVALSIAAIIVFILVRRRMKKQQQGIYSVPIDQDKKDAV